MTSNDFSKELNCVFLFLLAVISSYYKQTRTSLLTVDWGDTQTGFYTMPRFVHSTGDCFFFIIKRGSSVVRAMASGARAPRFDHSLRGGKIGVRTRFSSCRLQG